MWEEFEKMPKELQTKLHFGNMFGKYHYHYENKNGTIGLIRIMCLTDWNGKNFVNRMMWEACGVLDFQKFWTKKEAETAIYEALHEAK